MDGPERFGICIGAFAHCADRFVVTGYHESLSIEEMVQQASLVEGTQGVEIDYPTGFDDAQRL